MEQFEELKQEMEQVISESAFEDCDEAWMEENPFEEGCESEMDEEDDDHSAMEEDEEPDDREESNGNAEQKPPRSEEPEKTSEDVDVEEEKRRAEHEEAEARRKMEWETRQKEKREAMQAQLERIAAMNEKELMEASIKRVNTDTERLTRRNMKECVSEYIQTLCLEDAAFAQLVLDPKKTMIHCFHYINRKAREFIEQEMKDNDIKPENGVYGGDVPDDLCYQWAEEYFRDSTAKEDEEKEDRFVPRPYHGKSSSKPKQKKNPEKKKAGSKKPEEKKTEKGTASDGGQISFMEQISLDHFMAQEVKAE